MKTLTVFWLLLFSLNLEGAGWQPHVWTVSETDTNVVDDFTAYATTFHGTNGIKSTVISGPTNSKYFTFSMWVKPVWDGEVYFLNSANNVQLGFNSSSNVVCVLKDGNSNIVSLTTSLKVPSGEWSHIGISLDTSSESSRWVYINDTVDSSVTWTTYYDVPLYWLDSTWSVAQVVNGGYRYQGCMSEIYINTDAAIDLSVEGNRRKFISVDSHPVNLGADGSTPTGSQPAFYLKYPYTGFHTNAGYAGDFTVEGGGMENCTAP